EWGGAGSRNLDAVEFRPHRARRCRRPGIRQRQSGADGNTGGTTFERGEAAMTRALHILLLAGAAFAQAAPAEPPLSIRPSFRLGDAGVLCTAQVRPTDPRLSGIFDRSYLLTCRDAAAPIGSVLAVRRAVDLAREPSTLLIGALACKAEEAA